MFCCVKLVNLSNIIYSFFGTEKTKRIQCEQQLSSNLAFVKKSTTISSEIVEKRAEEQLSFCPCRNDDTVYSFKREADMGTYLVILPCTSHALCDALHVFVSCSWSRGRRPGGGCVPGGGGVLLAVSSPFREHRLPRKPCEFACLHFEYHYINAFWSNLQNISYYLFFTINSRMLSILATVIKKTI